ncbi:AfsR/SARP family transcriptional regulator [Nocardioides sp.]|uniref:AfsR/SARP family transcriptional regulator n=1 Tax=Nocardioides sp. TaxID=35761 RepID=UPI002ED9323A
MIHEQQKIQIRLLGPLGVRRLDGSWVAVEEWRTGKTADLLRILALNGGRPVRPADLIGRLWPDASTDHARGSLRTASSQIRRVVRTDCVVRRLDGLVLQDAWVDTFYFLQAARRAAVAARGGHHLRVLATAQAAEHLYVDDFHAHDDDSDWAVSEREHLRRARHEMLCDAATAAFELHRYRECLDLATTAIEVERSSETAHRLVMRAHEALGDVGSALRAFETCRDHLARELGADPSPQTQELHLRLLRGDSA